MIDRRRIVEQWKRSQSAAFVTLVRTQGSSYRAPGAHLLIGANAEVSGAISGGCLESEVVRKATWMARNGAVVERYSTFFDDTSDIPYGLGCGGVVDLLVEPTETAECRAVIDALAASLVGDNRRIITWLPHMGSPLRRAVIGSANEILFRSETVQPTEVSALLSNPPSPKDDVPAIYIQQLHPPLRLLVLGAGEDAKPVVTIAALLGWNVVVADGRTQLARSDRFPDAQRVTAASQIADLSFTSKDAAVIMTHSYDQDRALLAALLGSSDPPGYIGLLGASHRSSLLVSEVAAILGRSVAECCDRIWSPVGLDLGGDGAEAIALAVISEVQAWQNGKLAASRRLTAQRVAELIANRTSSQYLRAECSLR